MLALAAVATLSLAPVQLAEDVGRLQLLDVAVVEEGAGVGRALLERLVERSEAAGYWTLTAGVFPENEASLRVHKACGFREVGVRERLGQLASVWRDVLLLERRSTLVGT